MKNDLEHTLYHMLLESKLSTRGAEIALPALKQLPKDLRRDNFAPKNRKFRQSEEQMIRAWAEYRRELGQLRERFQQQQRDDELSWLVMFLIQHYQALARISIAIEPRFAAVGPSIGVSIEDSVILLEDWHHWVVDWLDDALREKGNNVSPPNSDKDSDSQEGAESPDQENRLPPSRSGFEF